MCLDSLATFLSFIDNTSSRIEHFRNKYVVVQLLMNVFPCKPFNFEHMEKIALVVSLIIQTRSAPYNRIPYFLHKFKLMISHSTSIHPLGNINHFLWPMSLMGMSSTSLKDVLDMIVLRDLTVVLHELTTY
jgi:hypothetical protein